MGRFRAARQKARGQLANETTRLLVIVAGEHIHGHGLGRHEQDTAKGGGLTPKPLSPVGPSPMPLVPSPSPDMMLELLVGGEYGVAWAGVLEADPVTTPGATSVGVSHVDFPVEI